MMKFLKRLFKPKEMPNEYYSFLEPFEYHVYKNDVRIITEYKLAYKYLYFGRSPKEYVMHQFIALEEKSNIKGIKIVFDNLHAETYLSIPRSTELTNLQINALLNYLKLFGKYKQQQ